MVFNIFSSFLFSVMRMMKVQETRIETCWLFQNTCTNSCTQQSQNLCLPHLRHVIYIWKNATQHRKIVVNSKNRHKMISCLSSEKKSVSKSDIAKIIQVLQPFLSVCLIHIRYGLWPCEFPCTHSTYRGVSGSERSDYPAICYYPTALLLSYHSRQ